MRVLKVDMSTCRPLDLLVCVWGNRNCWKLDKEKNFVGGGGGGGGGGGQSA